MGDKLAQPMPIPGKTNVTPFAKAAFIRGLAEQEQKGVAKYGTTLQTHNGRNAIQDAKAELIDAWQYLCQKELEDQFVDKRLGFMDVLVNLAVAVVDNETAFADSGGEYAAPNRASVQLAKSLIAAIDDLRDLLEELVQ